MSMRKISFNELSFGRIAAAIGRRVADIPEAIAWSLSAAGVNNREKNAKFRNIHSGERCIIICNGPSLNKTDMSLLRGEHSFCMNRAYLMFDEWGFTPTYFVASAKHVLEQFFRDICALKMPKFVRFSFRELYPMNNNCHYIRLPPRFNDKFVGDITQPMTMGATVTYSALQIAYYMGFKTVIIIGMDHRFSESGTPSTSEVRTQEIDKDHVHPNYFPKGVKWELPDLPRSERAYQMARDSYERDGRRIIDATVDGACTIFEKMSLEDALKR